MKRTSTLTPLPAFVLAFFCLGAAAAPVWVVAPPADAASPALDQTRPAASAVPAGTRLYWLVGGHRGPADYPVAAPGQVCDCTTQVVDGTGTYCLLPQWPRRVVACEMKP